MMLRLTHHPIDSPLMKASHAHCSLGHVGIHAHDLDSLVTFYRDVLGLQVTDQEPKAGMAFMSARPEEEHYQPPLCSGLDAYDRDVQLLQQVSFGATALTM